MPVAGLFSGLPVLFKCYDTAHKNLCKVW